MKVEYINPFIESVFNLFSTMLDAKVSRGKPDITSGDTNPRDLTALIGLSGTVKGTVALTFPTKTALNIVGRLLGMDITIVDDTIIDGLGELVNIITGSAKAQLSDLNCPPINLSLPTIVRGTNYAVSYPSGSTWIELPFESELGDFNLRITLVFEN